MSQWHDAAGDDIEIDAHMREVNIYVTDNDWGSVYVTLTFAQAKKIAEQIELIEKP